jgi:PIN domain nuclease of toxin-antitoxin system
MFERLVQFECSPLEVTNDHAWRVASLPLIHRDPFDRVIVAQAMVEGLILVTSDRILPRYECAVLKA